MAQKTVKKAAAAKTSTKKIRTTKISKALPPLYKERHPENHNMTGKFVGLYIIFALTTIAFAALAVYLFFMSSELLNKYEEIDPACRAGECVKIDHNANQDTDTNTNAE